MKNILKLAFKNFYLNKNRTITTIIMVLITVATFTGIAIMYESTIKGLKENVKKENGDHRYEIRNIPENLSPREFISNNLIGEYEIHYLLENEKENENREQISENQLRIQRYSINKEGKDEKEVEQIRKDTDKYIEELNKIQKYTETPIITFVGIEKNTDKNLKAIVEEGRLPEKEEEIAIVKDPDSSKKIFNLGTQIELQDKKYKVVGYVKHGIIETESKLIFVSKVKEEEKNKYVKNMYLNPSNYDSKVKEVKEELNKIAIAKGKDTNVKINTMLLELEGANLEGEENMITNAILPLKIMVYGLNVIVFLAGVTILYNSFNLAVVERKKQYGILKSLGAKNKQIFNLMILEALFIGTIGIILGILAGMLGDYFVISYISKTVTDIMKGFGAQGMDASLLIYEVNSNVIISVSMLTYATILAAGIIPALKAAFTTPIENIRGTEEYNVKARKVKTSKLMRRILGIEIDLARKNMKRARRRFRMATISLMTAFTLIFTITTIGRLISTELKSIEQVMNAFGAGGNVMQNVYVHSEADQNTPKKPYNAQNVEEEIRKKIEISKKVEQETIKQGVMPKERIITTIEELISNNNEDLKKIIKENLSEKYIEIKIKEEDKSVSKQKKEELSKLSKEERKNRIFENSMPNLDIPIMVVENIDPERKDKELEGIKDGEIFFKNVDILKEGSLHQKVEILKKEALGQEIKLGDVKLKVSKLITDEKISRVPSIVAGNTLEGYITLNTLIDIQKQRVLNNIEEEKAIHEYKGSTKQISYMIVYNAESKEFKQNKEKLETMSFVEKEGHNQYEVVVSPPISATQFFVLIKGFISILQVLLFGFLGLVVLMSITNIFTTITINILLRSRELATLKSVGMSQKQLNKMLRVENYILVIRSIILGTIISLAILILVLGIISQKGKVEIEFEVLLQEMKAAINWIDILISVGLVYLITAISTFIAKKSVKKENIIEVIRNENI